MSNSNNKSKPPLPLFWKIMVFLLPITALQGALFIIPHHIYKRNREEAWTLAIWGAITWAIILLLIFGFKIIQTTN
jgi:hypothetical protein